MKRRHWLRTSVLLLLYAVAGVWVGVKAAPLIQAWLTPAPPEIADNTRYFEGEAAPVVMFGTATCAWCAKTRSLLDRSGVAYRDHRIDASQDAMAMFRSLKADGVPVVLIGSRRIYGFDEAKIRAALQALKRDAAGARRNDDSVRSGSRGQHAAFARP